MPVDTDKLKAQYAIEEKRFERLFPFSADPLNIILKGHLLIEEQLLQIINAGLADPTAISKLRLSFSQKLGITKAISGKFFNDEIYSVIKQLNTIRNTLAHEAEPTDVDDLVDKLIKQSEKVKLLSHISLLPNNITKLYAIIKTCWTATATYKDVITVVNDLGSITHAISKTK